MASRTPDLTYSEAQEVSQFVHRCEHLRWRQGRGALPDEASYVHECWLPFPVPPFAAALAEAGEPGGTWCPLIDPALRDRAWSEWLALPADQRNPQNP
jgi:hypothetical protein